MKVAVSGIILSILLFPLLQMIAPFPYGLILWVLTVVGMMWYVKKYLPKHKYSLLSYKRMDCDDDPLTILKIRYSKGEITKEEFEEMKKELS